MVILAINKFQAKDKFNLTTFNTKLDAIDYAIQESIPSGIICAWSGTDTNIPEGWVICDGQNNTPNLTGHFIFGASGNNYPPGITGEIEATLSHEVTEGAPYYTLIYIMKL